MINLRNFKNNSAYTENVNSIELPNVSHLEYEHEVKFKGVDYSKEYLTFYVVGSGGSFSFSGNDLQYSIDDGETWNTLTNGESTQELSEGDTIKWKQTGLTPLSGTGIGTFQSTVDFNAYGNIMSLYYGDDFIGEVDLSGKHYAFRRLFQGNGHIIDASNLSLPATTLSESCYRNFFNCPTGGTSYIESNLLYPPKVLPATKMERECYQTMFQGCSKMLIAPELPATTLAYACYQHMFYRCESLVQGPHVLPAETLDEMCYYYMFGFCTKLSIPPIICGMNLAKECCMDMFHGCISLSVAPKLPAMVMAEDCYEEMFWDCSGLTIPPELPATTMAKQCYRSMFWNCESLVIGPTIPDVEVVDKCFYKLFYHCHSLKLIRFMVKNLPNNSYTWAMTYGIQGTQGTFIKSKDANWNFVGDMGIPKYWTIVLE